MAFDLRADLQIAVGGVIREDERMTMRIAVESFRV